MWNRIESETPTSAAYTKNNDRAALTDSVLIRALMKNTKIKGARINTHISGLCSSSGPVNW